jgi:hypothetical protein
MSKRAAAPAAPALVIVRILGVVDTRQYDEGPDGKFYPVPGSGDVAQCARCGRDHEVHATVELGDGTTTVVGTGCMGEASLTKAARSGASRAKRIRQLQAERRRLERLAGAYAAAQAAVAALTPPAIIEGVSASGHPTLVMGDVHVWTEFVRTPADLEERRRVLLGFWRDARLTELGMTYHHRAARRSLEDVVTRLAKAEAAQEVA